MTGLNVIYEIIFMLKNYVVHSLVGAIFILY